MRTEDFEKTHQEERMHVGYITGSRKVVFIKTGQGGSIYGYENKYLHLAIRLNAALGCSVFVAQTNGDTRADFDRELQFIADILGNQTEICYVGISKGGLIGCWHASHSSHVKHILAVNAPLMINFHNKTLPSLKAAERGRITMLYGTKDPSFRYTPFLSNHADLQIMDGADHHFSNHFDALTKVIEDTCRPFCEG